MQKYDAMLSLTPRLRSGFRRAWRITSWVSFVACCSLLTTGISPFTAYTRSDFGRDYFCALASRGDLAGMAWFLNEGADINRVGWESHFTPLGEAARSGDVSSIRFLLAHGADPNRCGDWRETPLDIAREANHPEAARMIQSAGGVSFAQLPREKQQTQ